MKSDLFKNFAVGGMFVCGLAMQFGVIPALERQTLLAGRGKASPQEQARLARREGRLTTLNIGLGLLVLAFTAWATAL